MPPLPRPRIRKKAFSLLLPLNFQPPRWFPWILRLLPAPELQEEKGSEGRGLVLWGRGREAAPLQPPLPHPGPPASPPPPGDLGAPRGLLGTCQGPCMSHLSSGWCRGLQILCSGLKDLKGAEKLSEKMPTVTTASRNSAQTAGEKSRRV